MQRNTWIRQALTFAAVAAAVCVLGFYESGSAQPPKSHEPFANSTAQQVETVQLLREINAQLKEQNELLRNGTLRVKLEETKKK